MARLPFVDTIAGALNLVLASGAVPLPSPLFPPYPTRNSPMNPISPRIHKYHLLTGISTILAVSSIALLFFYPPSQTVLYAFLISPTLSLLHHIFLFLAVTSLIARSAPQQRVVSHQPRRRCALSGPLSEIEKSTFNLLSLALLTVLAMATGGAAWLFIALDSLCPTTTTTMPNSNITTASWSHLSTSPASPLSSLALEHEREGSPPAVVWALQGGGLLAQAVVLASMFAIAAREARVTSMASWGDCPYERVHIGSDVERLLCVDESRSGPDTVIVLGDGEEEEEK